MTPNGITIRTCIATYVAQFFFADGLEGIFDEKVPFNIERLVNVLEELQKKERHALYPFVGAWNPKLQELAGTKF